MKLTMLMLVTIVCCSLAAAQEVAVAQEATKNAFQAMQKVVSPDALKTTRLRFVFDETSGPVSAPMKRHHILYIGPDPAVYRYDLIDYGRTGNEPYISSSFKNQSGVARWDGAVSAELLESLIKGGNPNERRGGFCYVGPNAGRSPDIILGIVGRTVGGRPVGEWLQGAANIGAELTLPTKLDQFYTCRTSHSVIRFQVTGALKYSVSFGPLNKEQAENHEQNIIEETNVEKDESLGSNVIPSVIRRRFTTSEGPKEERYDLRNDGSREITEKEFQEAVDPLLPIGAVIIDQKANRSTTIEHARRAFEKVPAE